VFILNLHYIKRFPLFTVSGSHAYYLAFWQKVLLDSSAEEIKFDCCLMSFRSESFILHFLIGEPKDWNTENREFEVS